MRDREIREEEKRKGRSVGGSVRREEKGVYDTRQKGRKLERGSPRAIPRHSALLPEQRSRKERWQNWEGAATGVDGTSEERE